MNISGILVVTAPEHSGTAVDQLQGMEDIDVHYCNDATGRIVITREAESIGAEIDGLKRMRALPPIILAEMSCHYFQQDGELVAADNQRLDCHAVPKYIDKPKNTDRTVKNKRPMSRDHCKDDLWKPWLAHASTARSAMCHSTMPCYWSRARFAESDG